MGKSSVRGLGASLCGDVCLGERCFRVLVAPSELAKLRRASCSSEAEVGGSNDGELDVDAVDGHQGGVRLVSVVVASKLLVDDLAKEGLDILSESAEGREDEREEVSLFLFFDPLFVFLALVF